QCGQCGRRDDARAQGSANSGGGDPYVPAPRGRPGPRPGVSRLSLCGDDPPHQQPERAADSRTRPIGAARGSWRSGHCAVTQTQTRELTATEAARGARELIEYCFDKGWTDGLPVVPPIQEFVDEFLAHTDRDPDEVLMVQEHLDRTCTVRHAAINAVM